MNLVIGGSGPPVLLLHGYPQTHAMWHAVAPVLAQDLTVVAADLRGYGDSSKPESGEDHAGYSKRTMAQDQVEVMAALGFDSFAVVGHDRGGRVAHRMALDHPRLVTRLAVLDIVPTHTVFSNVSKALATDYYHWFFLIQPYDFPERLIGADPDYYLEHKLGGWSAGDRPLRTPKRWRSTGAASAIRPPSTPAVRTTGPRRRSTSSTTRLISIAGSTARCWRCGAIAGRIAQLFDVLDTWRDRASDVHGRALSLRPLPGRGGAGRDRGRAGRLPYLMKRISAYFGSGHRSSATSFSSASPSSRTRSSAVSWRSRAWMARSRPSTSSG